MRRFWAAALVVGLAVHAWGQAKAPAGRPSGDTPQAGPARPGAATPAVAIPATQPAARKPAAEPQASAAQPRTAPQAQRPTVFEALRARTTEFRVEDTPWRDAVEQLARQMGVSVAVRWRQLRIAGVDPNIEVSLSLRDVTYETVLQQLMREVELSGIRLAYEVSAEVLTLTTYDDIASRLVTKRYYVRDLVHEVYMAPLREEYFEDGIGGIEAGSLAAVQRFNRRMMPGDPPRRAQNARFSGNREMLIADVYGQEWPARVLELADAIKGAIEPESWDIHGGRGTIAYYDGYLLVRASPFVHQQLGLALAETDALRGW